MPTNVTAEYKKAGEAFRKARDPRERLECLREMMRTIPRHKGTEHLQADIKSRIKQLTEQLQQASYAIGQQMYAQQEAAGGQPGPGGNGSGQAPQGEGEGDGHRPARRIHAAMLATGVEVGTLLRTSSTCRCGRSRCRCSRAVAS